MNSSVNNKLYIFSRADMTDTLHDHCSKARTEMWKTNLKLDIPGED